MIKDFISVIDVFLIFGILGGLEMDSIQWPHGISLIIILAVILAGLNKRGNHNERSI